MAVSQVLEPEAAEKPAPPVRCKCCNRILKNPDSANLKLGPVCTKHWEAPEQ